MKYIFRTFCALVLYPLFLAYCAMVIIIVNIGLIIWYFNFKRLFWFENYYFYIWRDAGHFELIETEDGEFRSKLVTYDEYYKTPYDMIRNKLTREYK